jgi:hypothetical protein
MTDGLCELVTRYAIAAHGDAGSRAAWGPPYARQLLDQRRGQGHLGLCLAGIPGKTRLPSTRKFATMGGTCGPDSPRRRKATSWIGYAADHVRSHRGHPQPSNGHRQGGSRDRCSLDATWDHRARHVARTGRADASVNDGCFSFDGGQHRNPKGQRRAATRRVPPMRRTFRVVVTIKLNPATVILAMAALIKVLV